MSLPNTHYGADRIGEMLENCRTLLFIGAGGVSMCSLAELALLDGFRVLGSDRCDSGRLERLRQKGAEICVGHDAGQAEVADAGIYTVAIDGENPQYLAMKRAGKPLISRADYLGYVMMRYRKRIGIAGMNGKSTTTAMCGHILRGAGDPTVFCGAEASALDGASCLIGREKQLLVFEACEYKDSFLDFAPNVAVILNVGMDHVDYFENLAQIQKSFRNYAELVGADGVMIANADDENTVAAMDGFNGNLLTFGRSARADFRAVNVESHKGCRRFDLVYRGEKLCEIGLLQPGDYQVENALAAAAATYVCGVEPNVIRDRIATYVGVKRRMEYKGKLNGGAVYDDYAHHPTAIAATLAGAREMGFQRIFCVYQPHTYSRTAGLFEEFSRAFDCADRVIFADIYAAREQNVSGVSSEQLANAVGDRAIYCDGFHAIAERLACEVQPNDLVLVMGAGDIDGLFPLLPLE